MTEKTMCTLCAPGSNEEQSPGFYHGCMCNDEPGGVVNGWKCDGQGNLTRVDDSGIPQFGLPILVDATSENRVDTTKLAEFGTIHMMKLTGIPITPEIPEGMMLVSRAWQPIMDEIERRGDKMDGNTDDFTVTIKSEDYRAIS